MFSLKGSGREAFGSRGDGFDALPGSEPPAFPLWHIVEAQLHVYIHVTAKCMSWMLFCRHFSLTFEKRLFLLFLRVGTCESCTSPSHSAGRLCKSGWKELQLFFTQGGKLVFEGSWAGRDRRISSLSLHSPVQILQLCAVCPCICLVTTAGTASFCFPLALV